MEVIRPQWGAIIRSDNKIKQSHIDGTLSNISSEFIESETFVESHIHPNGEENAVKILGFGLRQEENVKLFTRQFRKYLRIFGHTLDGNVWLYGEKPVNIKEESVVETDADLGD